MTHQPTVLVRFRKRALGAGAPLLLAAFCISGLSVSAEAAGTETVLYSFTGSSGDQPTDGLFRDKHGNLFGDTYFGGADGKGVVFEVAANGTESTLYNFTGGTDGGEPIYGGVITDKRGNVYGAAQIGGADNKGVVYKVAPDGTETVIYSFTGGSDGSYPESTLVRDKAGNLYGTAATGGANGDGTVFEISASGTFTTLHSFAGTDGNIPIAGLTQDKAGNLYGTTLEGGGTGCSGYGCGTVFEVAAGGTFTMLHSFTGGTSDGINPFAGVIVDKSGNLYGTAEEGGANNKGVVFEIAANGTESILHSFAGGTDGEYPISNLTFGKKHALYGTTLQGGSGSSGYGTVFEIAKNGTESVLYAFSGGSDGGYVYGGVVLDKKTGNFYGTTQQGGADNYGTVFELTP